MKTTPISPNALSLRQDAPECYAREPFSPAGGCSTGGGREAPQVHLTPRQLEVLALLCEGLPNKLICRQLNISAGTVKVHISCILRELGVSSRLQAVVSARRYGLDAVFPVRSQGERAYSGATEQRSHGLKAISAPVSHRWAVAA